VIAGALLVAVLSPSCTSCTHFEKQNKPLFTNRNVETKDVEVRDA